MAKFVVLILAAMAFQAAMAGSNDSWERQQREVQWMSGKIREICSDITGAIQNVQTDNNQGRRSLMAQTNEFGHNIRDVVYRMYQTAQNVQGEDRKEMQQFAWELSEIAQTLEQAINSEPNQMKAQLKAQVERCAAKAEKLAERFQEMQKPQGQERISRAMKRAVMDLHAAFRKLQVQAKLQNKNTQEVNSEIQAELNEIPRYMQNVGGSDERTAEDLMDCAQRLSRQFNNMVDKLQREADNQEGEAKNILQQVANRLSEKRSDLEQTANKQGNTQQRTNDMKDEIKETLRDCAQQCQRLMQVAQQSGDQQGEGVKHVVRSVMMDCMCAAKTMKTQLQMIAEQRN